MKKTIALIFTLSLIFASTAQAQGRHGGKHKMSGPDVERSRTSARGWKADAPRRKGRRSAVRREQKHSVPGYARHGYRAGPGPSRHMRHAAPAPYFKRKVRARQVHKKQMRRMYMMHVAPSAPDNHRKARLKKNLGKKKVQSHYGPRRQVRSTRTW